MKIYLQICLILAFFILGLLMPTTSTAAPNAQLSVSEKVFGLSTIWMEVRRNFPYRERLNKLDADYLQAIKAVSDAPDLKSYYRELQIFLAKLQDGHTFIQLPKDVFMTKSRPSLGVTRVSNVAVVTWVRSDLAAAIPLGSIVQTVDGQAFDAAAIRAHGTVFASSPHIREDKAYLLAMEGERDSPVALQILTPESPERAGETRSISLIRGEAWPEGATALSLRRDEKEAVTFKWLEAKNVACITINSFADNSVYEKFRQHLPALRAAKTVMIDLRRNNGGDGEVGFKILSHFLQTTGKGSASVKFLYDPEQAAAENNNQSNFLAANSSRGMKQVKIPPDIIRASPAADRIKGKLIILTSHETVSAAEDFLVAATQIKHIRIGTRTAGSTGQTVNVRLPGGGTAHILAKKDTFPNGKEFIGVGIPADIEIEPTIEDIRHERDVIMTRAIELIHQGKI
jgi:carboxyl-terminal processing protease